MKSYSDKGIVIKIQSIGEADKIVVFLTQFNSTIATIAKGAARSKSKKVSLLDTLNFVKISLYRTQGLDILKELELIEDYGKLKSDKKIINSLLYILEVLQRLNISENGDVRTFKLLKQLLDLMSLHKELSGLLIAAFELKLLDYLGFTPNLTNYQNVDREINENEKRDLANNGSLGYNLVENARVDDLILKIQKYILTHNLEKILVLNLSQKQIKQLRSIHRFWIETIIENRLKSTKLLKD